MFVNSKCIITLKSKDTKLGKFKINLFHFIGMLHSGEINAFPP